MNNRDTLIEIMVNHKLERREIANLLHVKREEIEQWLASTESTKASEAPDMAIELLEIKLGVREAELYKPEASD